MQIENFHHNKKTKELEEERWNRIFVEDFETYFRKVYKVWSILAWFW